MADSSTDAMPSITVPSPGISSPASTTTTSPRRSSDAGFSPPSRRRATVSVRIARSACGLGLAAALGQRLGQVREDDREPQPDPYGEAEPGGLVAAAQRGAAEGLDQPADRGDQRADLDHEHHRVADLVARVELHEALHQRRPQDRRVEQRARLASFIWRSLPVKRQVQLEHVHAGLAEEAELSARPCSRRSARSRAPAAAGALRRPGAPGSGRWPRRCAGPRRRPRW